MANAVPPDVKKIFYAMPPRPIAQHLSLFGCFPVLRGRNMVDYGLNPAGIKNPVMPSRHKVVHRERRSYLVAKNGIQPQNPRIGRGHIRLVRLENLFR
jgi:hypothetical protein